MKPILIATWLVGVLGLFTPAVARADAETLYTCGDGILQRVETVADFATGRQVYLVTVQLNQSTYTGYAATDTPWNLNPTRLTLGTRIYICVNTTKMVLDRLDDTGTDFHARVVRVSSQSRSRD
jgi:hypothetical protein